MNSKRKAKLVSLKIAVNVCRVLLAVTFLFSGFVKANDPLGMVYKIEDYYAAWGIDVHNQFFIVVLAVLLALVEIMMGVYLLLGILRRTVTRFVLMFMSVMTALTVYIYIANPVEDCGCFGDALVLTNGETLMKNIVLLMASVLCMRFYRLMPRITGPTLSWGLVWIFVLSALGFAGYSIVELPLIDFRPYKVGTDLHELLAPAGDSHPTFDVQIVYERDGEELVLSAEDDDPDSTWNYLETRRIKTSSGSVVATDFYMTDRETDEDFTDEMLEEEGETYLLIIPLMEVADQGCIGTINEIYDNAVDKGTRFYCITASDDKAIESWIDHTGAEYPIYRGDERTLKTIVRANPGLVLIKDGVIQRKWSNWNM